MRTSHTPVLVSSVAVRFLRPGTDTIEFGGVTGVVEFVSAPRTAANYEPKWNLPGQCMIDWKDAEGVTHTVWVDQDYKIRTV